MCRGWSATDKFTVTSKVREVIWSGKIRDFCRWSVKNDVYHLSCMTVVIHVVDISFTVCLFVFLSAGILVTDISGVGRHRAMKFCRMVDLGVRQVISPFGELCPGVSPPVAKK